MKSLLFALCFTLAVGVLQNPSQAASFTQLLVYGDSLSDVGRVGVATGGLFPPYAFLAGNGRFSNGPVWTESQYRTKLSKPSLGKTLSPKG